MPFFRCGHTTLPKMWLMWRSTLSQKRFISWRRTVIWQLSCCFVPHWILPGNVVLYDATAKRETVKISNTAAPGAALLQDNSDYQLFVNGKEQICVMQVEAQLPSWDDIWQIPFCCSQLLRPPVAGTSTCTPIPWVVKQFEDLFMVFMEAFQGTWLYRINLDLYKYGLSRDESVSEEQ